MTTLHNYTNCNVDVYVRSIKCCTVLVQMNKEYMCFVSNPQKDIILTKTHYKTNYNNHTIVVRQLKD